MNRSALATPRTAILAVGALCALWLVALNGSSVINAKGPFREMILFDRDSASTANGVWIMWSTPTVDYEEPMKTGFYHYTTLIFGGLASPFHTPGIEHFAVAGRVNALLQAVITLLAATWVVGTLSGWSWGTLLLPVYLAISAVFSNHATDIRVDMSMFLWEVLATWAMARFLVEPGPRWFRWSMVLITLAFAAKPSVLLMYFLFIGINAYQVFRDHQPFWRELRWRSGKGLLYFFISMLVASPNTVFSFGLFVASLRSEIDMSAKKLAQRPFWEWLTFLLKPDYLGVGLLVVGATLAIAFLAHRWRWRNAEGAGTRDPLVAFIWVNLAWSVGYWTFLMIKSRSFIERYMDPGWITFLLLWAALLGYWTRVNRRAGWIAITASAIAVLTTVQPNWRHHAAHLEKLARFDEIMAPKRRFMAEFEQLVPPGKAIVASPDILFESERYPKSSRFFRFKPRYFKIHPEYLVTAKRRLTVHEAFLDQAVSESNEHDVERKATIVFYKALSEHQLWGTVELVRQWDDPDALLYRFKKPITDEYVRWLTQQVYASVGVTPPKD